MTHYRGDWSRIQLVVVRSEKDKEPYAKENKNPNHIHHGGPWLWRPIQLSAGFSSSLQF